MADWTPPAKGCPVWIEICATDRARCAFPPTHHHLSKVPLLTFATKAHKFYSTVFNWTWKNSDVLTSDKADDATKPVMVDFNPSVNLSGGVTPVRIPSPPTFTPHPGAGGIVVYWLVDDVEAIGATIEAAGGRMVSEARKEGEHGLYRYFKDVDGNLGGVYQFKGM